MDETIRVKIIADTAAASSSLKSLGKETSNLGEGTNSVNDAVGRLNKTLNSLGFKSLQISGVVNAFNSLKKSSKEVGQTVDKYVAKNINDKLKNMNFVIRGLAMSFNNDLSGMLTKFTNKEYVPVQDIQKFADTFLAFTDRATEFDNKGIFSKSNKQIKLMRREMMQLRAAARFGTAKDFGKILGSFAGNWADQISKPKNKLVGFFQKIGIIAKETTSAILGFGKTVLNVFTKIVSGTFVAGLIGLAALTKNAFSVAKLGNDIDKTSQKVGMSTKEFQRWSYILERCGVDASNLKTAMRSLTAASMNKQNSSYFTQLGIDPDKLTQEQLFEKTVTELQKVEDRTVRAQMAYKLFGRASAELAPFLALNADEIARLSYQYELLGARMNGSVIRASVNLTDALQDLRAAWQGLKNTLAQGILPIITNIIVKITVLIAKINMILQVLFDVDDAAAGVTDRTQTITKNTQATAAAVKKLKTLIAGFDELNIFPSQDNPNGDIGSFLDDLEDYGNFGGIEPGQILPEWAIKDLENFRDNILPGIVEKLKTFIDKVKEIKAAWDELKVTGDTGTFLDRILEITGLDDNPFFKGLVDAVKKVKDWWNENVGGKLIGWEPIDWSDLWGIEVDEGGIVDKVIKAIEDVNKWFDETFGGGRLFGWDMPEGETFSDWWNNFWGGGDFLGLEIDWLDDVKEFIDGISEWWDEDIATLSWDGIFSDIREDYENSDLKGIVDDVIAWLDKMDTGFKALFTKEYWEEKFKTIGEAIETNPIVQKISGAWNDVKTWFDQHVKPIFTKEYWELKFAVIGTAIQNVPIVKTATNLWNTVKSWFNKDVNPTVGNSSFWKGKFLIAGIGLDGAALPTKVANVWNTIKTWWSTNVAPKFTASYWQTKFQSIKDGLGNVPIFQKAREVWDGVKAWWDTNIAPKFTIAYWKEKFNMIPNGMGYASILTGIQEKWNSVKSWWSTNVASKFTWTYWRDKFNSIKTGLQNVSLVGVAKSIINGLINTIETGINRMIDKINSSGIIGALSKIGVNIQLNRIYIPRLAKGGIIDQPTMAMMGEYPGARSNPEIVTPENRLTEIFQNSNDDIVSVLVQGFRQIVQAIDDKDTSISIGDTTIAKAAARGNQQYRLQTGTSLF